MNIRNGLLGVLASTILFATVASAETYTCQIRPNGHVLGLISQTIVININDAGNSAMVSSAVILATNKQRVVAKQLMNTSKRFKIKWNLLDVSGTGNKTYQIVSYRLVIWKSRGNEVSVVASFLPREGADTTITKEVSGSGRCTRS